MLLSSLSSTPPSSSPSVQIVHLKDGRNFTPWNTPYAVWATRCSGSLSTVSSFIIIYIILQSKTRLSSIYHRIMFGLSIADIIGSVSMALASWPMPSHLPNEEDFGYHWSGARLGNTSTCTAQGFFATFGIISMPTYNLMLCVYYFCTIYLNMRGSNIKKRVEPFLHVLPVMIGLSLALAPLPFNLYNPSMAAYAWCGPVPYPYECYLYPEEVDCIRGNPKMMEVTHDLVAVLSAVVMSLIILILLLVIKKIMQTDRMLRQLSDRLQGRTFVVSRLQQALNFQRNSKAAIIQAMAYIITVLLCILPGFLLSSGAVVTVGGSRQQQKVAEAVRKMMLLLLPLQGFFNCIIFVSHKVYNYRRVHENTSICQVLQLLLFTSAHEPTLVSRISMVSHHERVGGEQCQDDENENDDEDRGKDDLDLLMRIWCAGGIEISDLSQSQRQFSSVYKCVTSSSNDDYIDDDEEKSTADHHQGGMGVLQDGSIESSAQEEDSTNPRTNASTSNLDCDHSVLVSLPSRSTLGNRAFSQEYSDIQRDEPTRRKYYCIA